MKNYHILKLIAMVSIIYLNAGYGQQSMDVNEASKTTETVGEFTGILNYSVPLGSVSSGKLNASLMLSYVGNGFKPSEVAGSAGLGWALNDFGTIYKTSRGLEDTYRSLENRPYWSGSEPLSYPTTQQDLLSGNADGAWDIYTFNIMGNEGKFIVSPYNNNIIQLGQTEVKITFVSLWQFDVLLPDGSKAILLRKDHRPTLSTAEQSQVWHISSLYSYDNKDTLSFQYYSGVY